MTGMLVCLKISFEDKTNTHSVSSGLSHIDWGSDSASKLQLVSFDRDDLDKRHLYNQLLWILIVKAVLFTIPKSSF